MPIIPQRFCYFTGRVCCSSGRFSLNMAPSHWASVRQLALQEMDARLFLRADLYFQMRSRSSSSISAVRELWRT